MEGITELVRSCHRQEMHVYLPRFNLETTLDLNETFRQMGIVTGHAK